MCGRGSLEACFPNSPTASRAAAVMEEALAARASEIRLRKMVTAKRVKYTEQVKSAILSELGSFGFFACLQLPMARMASTICTAVEKSILRPLAVYSHAR